MHPRRMPTIRMTGSLSCCARSAVSLSGPSGTQKPSGPSTSTASAISLSVVNGEDRLNLDASSFFGGGDAGNRRREQVGIDQFARGADFGRGDQRFNIVVPAVRTGAGGYRFHADGLDSGDSSAQQRAAGKGLADFGIGPGDEPGAFFCGEGVHRLA